MQMIATFRDKLRAGIHGVPQAAVERGVPPSVFGYRYLGRESVAGYFRRNAAEGRHDAGTCRTIHPASVARNPLPRNVASRDELPRNAGWWGYSFHDVPERRSDETFIASLPNCQVFPCTDPNGEFWVTILNRDGRALELREMSFRRWQARQMRDDRCVHLESATWLVERVYHNHSHWLSAHLPKLLMFRELGLEDEVILPSQLPPAVEASLRMYGFEPERFRRFEPGIPLHVSNLTVAGTDRFRPDLLRLPRQQCPIEPGRPPWRHVFISREGAERRRLLNEDELRPMLEERGFEFVKMEALGFTEQVRLMRETAVLVAPHGAGLTNMMFCEPGTRVVELADLSFPNPNFYATASALDLEYRVIDAEGHGEVHPLERDLSVPPEALRKVLEDIH